MPASFSPVWLCATSWTVAHQTPLSMGFFWSRILGWVTISSLRGSSQPTYRTWISCVSCTGKRVLYHCAIWEAPHRYPSHTDTPPSYILQYFSISSPQPVISFCFFPQWSWFTSLSSIAICCCSGAKSCPTLCDPIAIVLNIFSFSCLLIWCNFSFTA